MVKQRCVQAHAQLFPVRSKSGSMHALCHICCLVNIVSHHLLESLDDYCTCTYVAVNIVENERSSMTLIKSMKGVKGGAAVQVGC